MCDARKILSNTNMEDEMKTKEFGEVEFISRAELPNGLLLRECSTGVLLETYFCDEGELNSYVLEEFPYSHLRKEVDLRKCLAVARQHEKDMNVPICVEIWESKSTVDSAQFWEQNDLLEADYDESLKKEIEHISMRLQKE